MFIRQIRGLIQLSQTDFARLLDVNERTARRWEAGEAALTGPMHRLLHHMEWHPEYWTRIRRPAGTPVSIPAPEPPAPPVLIPFAHLARPDLELCNAEAVAEIFATLRRSDRFLADACGVTMDDVRNWRRGRLPADGPARRLLAEMVYQRPHWQSYLGFVVNRPDWFDEHPFFSRQDRRQTA